MRAFFIGSLVACVACTGTETTFVRTDDAPMEDVGGESTTWELSPAAFATVDGGGFEQRVAGTTIDGKAWFASLDSPNAAHLAREDFAPLPPLMDGHKLQEYVLDGSYHSFSADGSRYVRYTCGAVKCVFENFRVSRERSGRIAFSKAYTHEFDVSVHGEPTSVQFSAGGTIVVDTRSAELVINGASSISRIDPMYGRIMCVADDNTVYTFSTNRFEVYKHAPGRTPSVAFFSPTSNIYCIAGKVFVTSNPSKQPDSVILSSDFSKSYALPTGKQYSASIYASGTALYYITLDNGTIEHRIWDLSTGKFGPALPSAQGYFELPGGQGIGTYNVTNHSISKDGKVFYSVPYSGRSASDFLAVLDHPTGPILTNGERFNAFGGDDVGRGVLGPSGTRATIGARKTGGFDAVSCGDSQCRFVVLDDANPNQFQIDKTYSADPSPSSVPVLRDGGKRVVAVREGRSVALVGIPEEVTAITAIDGKEGACASGVASGGSVLLRRTGATFAVTETRAANLAFAFDGCSVAFVENSKLFAGVVGETISEIVAVGSATIGQRTGDTFLLYGVDGFHVRNRAGEVLFARSGRWAATLPEENRVVFAPYVVSGSADIKVREGLF